MAIILPKNEATKEISIIAVFKNSDWQLAKMSVHVSEIPIRSEQTNMILDPKNILLREYDAPNMNNNITCNLFWSYMMTG